MPNIPAVYIGEELVGGANEIMALHLKGKLVPLLKKAKAIWKELGPRHSQLNRPISRGGEAAATVLRGWFGGSASRLRFGGRASPRRLAGLLRDSGGFQRRRCFAETVIGEG
nr:monothiol glutaredoxin-S2-like [Ipomoea batatas]